MKKTVLTALLVPIALSGFAQNTHRLIAQGDSLSGTTGIIERYDTTRFFYTGNRVDFDSSIERIQMFNNPQDSYAVQTNQFFDNNSNIVAVIFMSKVQGVWQNQSRTLNTFDASNRKVTSTSQQYNSGWSDVEKDSFVYDNNSNIIISFLEEWGTAPIKLKHEFTYDANHNVLTSLGSIYDTSLQQWSGYERQVYTYNANNKVVTRAMEAYYGGSWQPLNADTNIYNGNNLTLHFEYGPITLVGTYGLVRKDSNVYDGNNDCVRRVSSFPYQTPPYSERDTNSYDNAHNLIFNVKSSHTGNFAPWVNISRYMATYNANNLVSSIKKEMWDDATQKWTPSNGIIYLQRFHYENEDVSVKGTEMKNLSVKLYPNPASSFITLDIRCNTPEKTQVAIYSITGALMMQWNEDATASLHRMIPVTSLPAGNYILQVKGNTGNQSQVFTIAK